ncbi:MAG: hypothetical protein U0744_03135 [Gemmataceae bacterium]
MKRAWMGCCLALAFAAGSGCSEKPSEPKIKGELKVDPRIQRQSPGGDTAGSKEIPLKS